MRSIAWHYNKDREKSDARGTFGKTKTSSFSRAERRVCWRGINRSRCQSGIVTVRLSVATPLEIEDSPRDLEGGRGVIVDRNADDGDKESPSSSSRRTKGEGCEKDVCLFLPSFSHLLSRSFSLFFSVAERNELSQRKRREKKKIRRQESKKEPKETATRLPSCLLQSWRGLYFGHVPTFPRSPEIVTHHLTLTAHNPHWKNSPVASVRSRGQ